MSETISISNFDLDSLRGLRSRLGKLERDHDACSSDKNKSQENTEKRLDAQNEDIKNLYNKNDDINKNVNAIHIELITKVDTLNSRVNWYAGGISLLAFLFSVAIILIDKVWK